MLRIAVGSVIHEANTFAPRMLEWDDVMSYPFLLGDEVIEKAATLESAIPGFLRIGGDIEWVPLISSALPGGSGRLSKAAFGELCEILTSRIRAAGHLDACLLSIGGGMVADGEDLGDADGHLLAAVRESLPEGARLGVALDMHANMTERMLAAADVMLAYQTFPPHWDKHEIGAEIADLIVRTVRGELRPVMALASAPMLLQPEAQATRESPMRDVMSDAAAVATQPGVLGVSMVAGFAWCDVPEAGASVIVITDGDRDRAKELARQLAQRWFDRREAFRYPLVPRSEAVERALAHEGPKPLLLCDHADNVGAGGAGDATGLLAALLEAGARNIASSPTCDPAAVASCLGAGIGGELTLSLGGKRDEEHACPIDISGRVRVISDGVYRNSGKLWTGKEGRLGRCAVVVAGGIEIVISELPNSGADPAVFTTNGIDPATKSAIVIKSQIFGPTSYGEIVSGHIVVDGEGWATSNFSRLPYAKLRRPIFPLDADVTFERAPVTRV
jgi:microcystin degradation protein MlrC